MAPYKLIISYDGSEYSGYQRQGKQKTVQLELEHALRAIGWTGSSILAAGRTDAGVHAEGQVVVFTFDWKHGVNALQAAVNANLPDDISVLSAELAEDGFHPRYDAKWRTYRYLIYCSPVRNPLLDRYAWRVWPEVAFDLMQTAALQFKGRHDFRAFGKPPRKDGRTERIVRESEWQALADQQFLYHVTANGFLYHMVRRLVAAIVLVGQSQLAISELVKAIEGQKELLPEIAPPNGLVLESVDYE